MEIVMTSETKSVLAAALIAAFASPALAQGAAPLYYDATQAQSNTKPERPAAHLRRLTEGRNAAVVLDFGTHNGISSGRGGLVQSLGN
jgi:hypothetical protein